MNKRQQKVVTRFGQVMGFLTAHHDALPPEVDPRRRELGMITVSLMTMPVVEQSSIPESTSVVKARHDLRELHLKPLVAGARNSLKIVCAARYFLPPLTAPVDEVVLGAKAIAGLAKADQPLLICGGLPDDFLEQLFGAILTLEIAVRTQRGNHARGAVASAKQVRRRIEAGWREVRALDRIVRPLLANDRELLRDWVSSQWRVDELNRGRT